MSPISGGIGNVIASPELVEMAMAYSRSRIVCAAARLGIADALGSEERSVEDLAAACGADAQALYRLLRALAGLGITAEVSPRRFVLSAFGQPLRKDHPNSAWAGVIFWADLLADSWSYLTECVRSGKTAAKIMEGNGVATRWSSDPDASAIFRAVMGTAPVADYMPIVNNWDFSGRKTVADLGGGGGSLIAAVLSSNPHLNGLLVDRPESIEAARPRFASSELGHRCRLIAADLRSDALPSADVYLLKHVLHGYDDAVAIELLRNCRKALDASGCVLVIEFLLPDIISAPDPALQSRLMSDLNMLAVTGSKERSAAEWSTLFEASGFLIGKIIPVAELNISIVEAWPA